MDAYHRYWSCPQLSRHPDEIVGRTQWMRRLFDVRHADLACLWGRAILPGCLMPEPHRDSVEDVRPISTPKFSEAVARGRAVYTDGSGGPRPVPTSSRRVGSAAATIRVSTNEHKLLVDNVGVLISATPGRAIVPRAELWAAISAAKVAPANGRLTLCIYAAYVRTVTSTQAGPRLRNSITSFRLPPELEPQTSSDHLNLPNLLNTFVA